MAAPFGYSCGQIQLLCSRELATLYQLEEPSLDIDNSVPAVEVLPRNVGALRAPCIVGILVAPRDRNLGSCRKPVQRAIARSRCEIQQLFVQHTLPNRVEERENLGNERDPRELGKANCSDVGQSRRILGPNQSLELMEMNL